MSTGDLKPPTEDEYKIFSNLLPTAIERAKLRETKAETNYTRSASQQTINDLHERLKQAQG